MNEDHENSLVTQQNRQPREGWAEAFALMHRHGDDRLLDEQPRSRWDVEEWEWR